MIYLDLLINLSLLVSLTIVSGFINKRWPQENKAGVFLQGLLFGTVAVVAMLRPLDLGQGVIIDGRSVVLSLCSLFFGPVAAFISAVMGIICRIFIGGAGTMTGILSVLVSVAIGLAARSFYPVSQRPPSFRFLYLFGVIVHIGILTALMTLPEGRGPEVVANVGVSMLFLYPLATLLAGKILADQLLTFQHVTALQKSEQALEQSVESKQVLLDNIRTQVFYLTGEHRYGAVNQAHADFFGVSKEDLHDKDMYDFMPAEVVDVCRVSNREVFTTGRRVCSEEWATNSSGERRLLSLQKTPKLGPDGQVEYVVCSAEDITEGKAAEEALQRKNQEMERFVYAISHDLKSPLVTIITFLGMLEQDIKAENTQRVGEDIAYMHGAANKMEQLLEALLHLSRVGRTDTMFQTVTVAELIAQSLVSLGGVIKQQGIEVKVEPLTLTLYGDKLRLGQIWQNLIENAIKYRGRQSQPCIEVGSEEGQGETVFFVRDNGKGINPEHHERIFDLFCRLDSQSEGSGFGLALVKKIVDFYGGRIWVESAGLGHGSCFKFTLPKAQRASIETPIKQKEI